MTWVKGILKFIGNWRGSLRGNEARSSGCIFSLFSFTGPEGPESGSKSFKMSDPDKLVLHLSQLRLGTYVFKLTATDKQGAQGSDTVTVNVKEGDRYYYYLYWRGNFLILSYESKSHSECRSGCRHSMAKSRG